MIAKELRKRIIEHNKKVKANAEKASDMEIMIGVLAERPPEQLKEIFCDDKVVAILAKYGINLR